MDDPTQDPNANQPPLRVGDDEVERLLQQAESLTQEIVEGVGSAAASEEPAGQFGTLEPEPDTAVELVAQDVAQIRQAIDPPAEVVAGADADEPVGAATVESGESTVEEADDAEDHAAADEAAVDQDVEAEDAEVDAESAEETAPADEIEHRETDATEPVEQAADSAAAPVETTSPVETPARRGMVGLARHTVVYAGRLVFFAVPNLCMRVLVVLDLPFRWISPGVKNALGIIGIITLLMGGVAMFAPTVMQHNPYATMPPLPHKEEPAAGEHGAAAEQKESGGHEAKKPEAKSEEHGGGGHH